MPRIVALLTLLTLPLVVGCEGCRRDLQNDSDAEAPPLDEFTERPPLAFPGDSQPIAGGIKPGHWFTAGQPLRSNRADVRGRMQSQIFAGVANPPGPQPARAAGSLRSTRPLILPKGQLRRLDYRLLSPRNGPLDSQRCYLASRIVTPAGALLFDVGQQPFYALAASEYFFVILTSRPERFAPLQVADWVRPPASDTTFQPAAANYRMVIPSSDEVLPLAETMLDWSSTAVLFWDDLEAAACTPDQLRAISDWVHFGGQLIVNGAEASAALAGSGLGTLLPLRPTGNSELDATAATQLLRSYAVAGDASTSGQIKRLTDQSARLAVDGIVAPSSLAIAGTGNLVLERQIGRGRVVQSRFDLTSDWLALWRSYDSFFNGVILRRPPRRYRGPDAADPLQTPTQIYPGWEAIGADPALNTRFRIASRDAALFLAPDPPESAAAGGGHPLSQLDPTTLIDPVSGVSGWSDTSDAVSLCRQILRAESGIEIPQVSLVMRLLGLYLLLLVPVNYLVFRLLGRLEWAWLAVPVIAIGGAVLVAHAARLDIGFARSQTELGLLEMQANYPRGHVSRIVAIYNSLSSTYEIQFDTIDGAAAPLGEPGDLERLPQFLTGWGDGPALRGLVVPSNQVKLLRCESMLDVGGTIRMEGTDRLVNETSYDLEDLIVIEKSPAGQVTVHTAASCGPGSAVTLTRRPPDYRPRRGLPMRSEELLSRLAAAEAIPAGSRRLVARIDRSLPGMTITPSANQTAAQSALLVHLSHPELPAPQADENLLGDVSPAPGGPPAESPAEPSQPATETAKAEAAR